VKKLIYDTIEKEGFFFSKFSNNQALLSHLLEIEKPTLETKDLVLKVLKEFELDSSKVELVFEDFEKGDAIALHSHLIPADMQILIWAHEDEFLGREFIYGTSKNLNHFKPQYGDICFMKTNDLNFIHGVERLRTQCRVRTLLISYNISSKYGEHLTIDSKNLGSI
jgi:hypothetical protein